jgi:hypothetical protein
MHDGQRCTGLATSAVRAQMRAAGLAAVTLIFWFRKRCVRYNAGIRVACALVGVRGIA